MCPTHIGDIASLMFIYSISPFFFLFLCVCAIREIWTWSAVIQVSTFVFLFSKRIISLPGDGITSYLSCDDVSLWQDSNSTEGKCNQKICFPSFRADSTMINLLKQSPAVTDIYILVRTYVSHPLRDPSQACMSRTLGENPIKEISMKMIKSMNI